ncbi:8826_t:CDS:2 [Scutellospora calospora]|uniref:8826_t:CDS:1 n=1 Tax=Scutellospora calospora TaxID=85575 RepID=A0ACA9JUD6_9GLOM|nr:8826_t:CDS:2 [Scutellospora calospora]
MYLIEIDKLQTSSSILDKDFSSKHMKIENSNKIFDNIKCYNFQSDRIFYIEDIRSNKMEV